MNHEAYMKKISEKLQLLQAIGEQQPALRLIEHIDLAVDFFYFNDIEESLKHFYFAESLSRHTIVRETDLAVTFNEFIAICREYGRMIYKLGDAYVEDAKSIYLFAQRIQEQAPQDCLWEKGTLAYNLGVLYIEHKMYGKAYEQFEAAADTLNKMNPVPASIKEIYKKLTYFNYFNLALCSYKLLKFDVEEESFLQAAKIQYTLEERDDIDFIQTLFKITAMYLQLHQTKKAGQVLQAAGKIMQTLEQIPAAVYYRFRFYESTIYAWNSENKRALAVIDGCLSQNHENPMPLDQLYDLLILKHTVLLELKQPEQSLAVIDQIFRLIRENQDMIYPDKKELYRMRAETYDELEETELSIQYFQLALQEYEKEHSRDIFWEILFCTNYSLALMNGGCYNEARKTAETCIALIDEMKLEPGQYNYAYQPVFLNLGIICMRQLQLDHAENYFFIALDLCRKTAPEESYLKDEILILGFLGDRLLFSKVQL